MHRDAYMDLLNEHRKKQQPKKIEVYTPMKNCSFFYAGARLNTYYKFVARHEQYGKTRERVRASE